MRILHLIASTDPRSGGPIAGILGQEQSTGGVTSRAEREIASLDTSDAPHIGSFPIKINALGRKLKGNDPLSRFLNHYHYSPDYVPWIQSNLHRFDVVFVHGMWNYASFAASRVLATGDLPYFVFTHGMMDPWFRDHYPLKHLAKQASWIGVEGRLLMAARSVLFTCEEERIQAKGVLFGHRYRERVVGYGTIPPPETRDSDFAELDTKLSALNSRPFLLFLGRIHEKKGVDLLIEGFARSARGREDLDLVIAGPGSGSLVDALKSRSRDLGIDSRIHWPGGLFGSLKWAALRRAEAFILPSHQENFGIAVAESLSCSTPVLISDKVNIWRDIQEDGSGLVAADTAEGVESLLSTWRSLSDVQKTSMRDAAHKSFASRYDMYVIGPALLEFVAEELNLQRPWRV